MNGLESPIFQPDTPGSHTRNPSEIMTPNQIITLSVDFVYPLLAILMALLKAFEAPGWPPWWSKRPHQWPTYLPS